MNIVGLITARGGSTRVPRKNLIELCGHPLIAWSIMQARAATLIDDVVVTTDDEEIADVAKEYGAEVIMRPVWENGVTCGVAFKHAMDQIGPCDHILTMLPTSPLKRAYDLDAMIKLYLASNVLTMTTACPMKEMCVLKNTEPYESRYGIDWNEPGLRASMSMFDATWHIYDKFWNYAKLCGGWGISEYNWQMGVWAKNPRLDIDIDTRPLDTTTVGAFYAVEEWQCFEIDYPEDVALVTVLMEAMILQGQSIEEVYGIEKPFKLPKAYGNGAQMIVDTGSVIC